MKKKNLELLNANDYEVLRKNPLIIKSTNDGSIATETAAYDVIDYLRTCKKMTKVLNNFKDGDISIDDLITKLNKYFYI